MRPPLSAASPPDPLEPSLGPTRSTVGGGTSSGTEAVVNHHAADPRWIHIVNPLNALVGFAGMLADVDHELSGEQRHRYAARVREAAEALERVMTTHVQVVDNKELDLGESFVSSGTFRVSSTPSTREEEVSSRRGQDSALGSPLVFIVDADEANRELIAEYLDGSGYHLALLGSVGEARELARTRPPDLVVLDPGTNGDGHLDAARALAMSNPRHLAALVLVRSSFDHDMRFLAEDVGRRQVLMKPLNHHELRAAVKSLLDFRLQQEALLLQAAQLRSLQRFKDETTGTLVNDFKSPLSAMMMNIDFVLADLPNELDAPEVRSALSESRVAGAKLCRLVANLLDIARADDGRLLPRKAKVDVDTLFDSVVLEYAVEAQARKVSVQKRMLLDRPIDADPDLIGRVLAKLFERVLRYTVAGGSVGLVARHVDHGIELLVETDGKRAAPDWQPLVFDEYAHGSNALGANRGTGLYFCRVAVEAHRGHITFVTAPVSIGPPVLPAQAASSAKTDATMSTCFRVSLPDA